MLFADPSQHRPGATQLGIIDDDHNCRWLGALGRHSGDEVHDRQPLRRQNPQQIVNGFGYLAYNGDLPIAVTDLLDFQDARGHRHSHVVEDGRQ